ncbi:MAG: hypothetical protein AAFO04_29935 [Cyanobacteria bacterium J06592_8]
MLVLAQDSSSPSWRSFFENSKEPTEPQTPPDDGGSRTGGDLCLIAPHNNQKNIKIWSDRPTFTWEGEITKLENLLLKYFHKLYSEE